MEVEVAMTQAPTTRKIRSADGEPIDGKDVQHKEEV